jgi:hypothetical protein
MEHDPTKDKFEILYIDDRNNTFYVEYFYGKRQSVFKYDVESERFFYVCPKPQWASMLPRIRKKS